jgi:hypothetical protein
MPSRQDCSVLRILAICDLYTAAEVALLGARVAATAPVAAAAEWADELDDERA